MAKLIQQGSEMARHSSPCVLCGESGSGKTTLARAIHLMSERRGEAFHTFHCEGLSSELMESELFGESEMVPGFPFAARKGFLRQYQSGSLLIHSPQLLPLDIQQRLMQTILPSEPGASRTTPRLFLSFTKTSEYLVGSAEVHPAIRIWIQRRRLHVPPLRERREDCLPLALHFLRSYSARFDMPIKSFSKEAIKTLLAYDWPSNVRELEQVIQKALLEAPGEEIGPTHFGLDKKTARIQNRLFASLREVRKRAETRAIEEVLKHAEGNISLAGKLLEVDRKWLQHRIRQYGIDLAAFRVRKR